MSLVTWSPLYGVVEFLGCGLLQRLCKILLHFLFRLKIDATIFCAVVDFIAMVPAVWRFQCVWASAVSPATV
jgi:hypothetical protein